MIFDSKWKSELKHLSWEILFWCRLSILGSFAEHQLNRAVLYSATILRKIIEDETEAEAIVKEVNMPLQKLKTVHYSLEAITYQYTGEEGWTIRSKLCASDYGKGQDVHVSAKNVCNWLLHSYVWGVAHTSDEKNFAGFLVALDFDKEKIVHYVSFKEWQKLIVNEIQNAVF